MATLRWSEGQLAVKVESLEGTAEALTAAEAKIRVENPTIRAEWPFRKSRAVSSSLSQFKGSPLGPRVWRLTFDVPMAGSGTPGTAPSWGVLLNGSLTNEALNPGTSATYTPTSTASDDKSLTIALYVDGKRYLLNGARCNPTQVYNAGEVPMLRFECLGGYNEPTDAALLSGVAYESTVASALVNGTFTFGGTHLLGRSLEINHGNVLVVRPDFEAANGVKSVVISRREPSGILVVEDELVSTKNFFNLATAGTESALVFGPFGAAGNIITLTCPKAQIEVPEQQNIDDLGYVSLPLSLNRNTGNDEWSLVLT